LPYFLFHLLIPFPRVCHPVHNVGRGHLQFFLTVNIVLSGGVSVLNDAYDVKFLWIMSSMILSWSEAGRTGTKPVSLQMTILGSSEIVFRLVVSALFRCPVAKRVSHIGILFYQLCDKFKLTSVWLTDVKHFSLRVWLWVCKFTFTRIYVVHYCELILYKY